MSDLITKRDATLTYLRRVLVLPNPSAADFQVAFFTLEAAITKITELEQRALKAENELLKMHVDALAKEDAE